MYRRFFNILVGTLIFLCIAFASSAQASGGEEGGNAQSLGQVVVQIVLTGIVLKVLHHFDLP